MEPLTNYEKKQYQIKVIPEEVTPPGTDSDGNATPGKYKYVRTTNPSEKALAIKDEDGNPVFSKQQFLQLQLTEKSDANPLDGDVSPYTLNIFERSHSELFDTLVNLMESGEYTELKTGTKARVMNNKLPGLLRNVPLDFEFYAMRINKAGEPVKLMQNSRNPLTGDFEKEPVKLNYVRYFLLPSEVNKDDDMIKFNNAKKAVMPLVVKGSSKVQAKMAEAEAEEDEKTEVKKETAKEDLE